MNPRSRLFFFGVTEVDRPFIEAVANKLGLPFTIRRSGIVYRALARVPRLAASVRMQRLAQIISPWVEAIEISIFTRPTDLILIRNIRTGISYLTAFDPLRSARPRVVLTWFTLKCRPPAHWSRIYRRALIRAFRVFVFTPAERFNYAQWFGVSSTLFDLAVLEAPPIPSLNTSTPTAKFDVIMTGETNRDWQSYVAVCERLSQFNFAAVMPLEHASRLPRLPNLKTFARLPFNEYCDLIAQSTIQLILVRDHGVAVGQRDFLLAGQLEAPLVATAVESMQLYDPSGEGTLFVQEGDVDGICDAVNRLLANPHLRATLTASRKRSTEEFHSIHRVSSHWSAHLKTDKLSPSPRMQESRKDRTSY